MLPKKKANPSSKACLACRDKHLRCDGQMPVCGRCASVGLQCVFVQSRRGCRGGSNSIPDLQPTSRSSNPAPLGSQQDHPPIWGLVPPKGQGRGPSSSSEDTISMPHVDTNTTDEEYLIGLYYRYIHPAHPFILPRKLYNQNRAVFPIHLRKAICFIASHHLSACTDQYRDASDVVFDPGITEDAYKVQALILITLASYARFERDRGNDALDKAIGVSHRIGLGSNNFDGNHEPVFQESWRRTWWELYTITGLISLIGGTNMRLSQPAYMNLPYDCEVYEACQVSDMGNVEEMQRRFQADSSFKWSSFAFRIEAMRILARVLDITNDSLHSECDAANASISSYLLSLPAEKREGLKADGEVDEVMSCALMTIHLAGICLNLPQSTLAHVRSFKTVCGNERVKGTSETPKTHQAAALRSANALTKLISSHTTTLKTLSPCFSCAIAFSAVVQLPEYLLQTPPEAAYLKENLQLALSALQSLGEIWPLARVVRGQIAQFSREVIGSKPSPEPFPAEPLLPLLLEDQPMPDEQWLQNLISEDLIVPEVQGPTMPIGMGGYI